MLNGLHVRQWRLSYPNPLGIGSSTSLTSQYILTSINCFRQMVRTRTTIRAADTGDPLRNDHNASETTRCTTR